MNTVEARRQKLQRNLDHIVKALVERYDPERIILYGSMSIGDIHDWSDLDLVVIKRTEKGYWDRVREVVSLCHADVGVQYLVYTPEEFERFQKEGYFFINEEILRKGKVIYERTQGMVEPG